ncbi:hypothetical protein V2S66_26715 [Streptomyces sp. V4-01]|uniref:Uncharacterized protein n=1 Tax=Actinacidiphila polyblastidii TaxID=3110430 RepID=A0ABU7PJY4_9ACTN|nr:hypothetical protein [Streptomyces sp. V4-01]
MMADAEYYEIKTEVSVIFPASGASDLTDPWNGRTVIPETVRIILISTETPDETREWAYVDVTGPRRLRSGDRGQPITSNGWETAFPSAKGHTFVSRPDWLTELLAEHLPEDWNRALLGLKGGA